VAWRIIEIETATPGWRTLGAGGREGGPVAVWALAEDDDGRRVVVGLDATDSPRVIDAGAQIDAAVADDGGYTYRAPLS
jgi:uncharacterized caspase-like protein